MKGHIDGGMVFLQLSASELRTLFHGVEREALFRAEMAYKLEREAEGRDALARDCPRGRVANRRLAGELRSSAAAHRAFQRDAADLIRVLHPLTTDPDVR